MGRARDAVRQMRRDLHREMSVAAFYIAQPGATPVPCTIRPHDKFEGIGAPVSGPKGYAERQEVAPHVIFLNEDAPPLIRTNAIVSVEPGEAYRINNTHPPHGITTTAEVTRLTPAEAQGLPVPGAA